MSTITAILQPDDDGSLHLPLPAELRHSAVKVTATLEPATEAAELARGEAEGGSFARPRFGCLAGKIELAPDFDELLFSSREPE